MSDKAKDFFAAFKAGKVSRRELMSGAGKLGKGLFCSSATVPHQSLARRVGGFFLG